MNNASVDIAKLPFMLTSLRLPTFTRLWPDLTQRADREGWPAARLLAALSELELAERVQRRIQRNLAEARLPGGKTLDSFDFTAVPMVSKAHVMALASGDVWLAKGANILMFGPPGSGKTHLSAALGLPWSKTASGFCSPGRPISSRNFRAPDVTSLSKAPSTNSTSTI